jgi:hypothetical protein
VSEKNELRQYKALTDVASIRLYHLITLAKENRDRGSDILRAAVVLTHAYLEDFLRTLARNILPDASAEVLNGVPLVGIGSNLRPEKFYLGKLVPHRGKNVDDVIRESVAEHLGRISFNTVEDIVHLLKDDLGFDISPYEGYFPDIAAMMKRRHLIVHRADRVTYTGELNPEASEQHSVIGGYLLQAISVDQVNAWIAATFQFITSVVESLAQRGGLFDIHP